MRKFQGYLYFNIQRFVISFIQIHPFPNDKILDSSKINGFADNFELDDNGRKFSKRVENTVGKGEIACYEQFLLFLQCFQMTCTADAYKPGLVWERVNHVKLNYASIYRS